MSRETHREANRVERVATAGVVMLATGSFTLSYDALHQLAVANQVPRPLAWIWPLIVDGFIIVASLAILHAVQHKRAAHYPWSLLAAFSTLSVAFNVLHAPPTAIARLVAAIPPLTLVLSFELLMRQLRDRTPIAAHTPAALGSRSAQAKSPTDQIATTDPPTGSQSLLQRARDIQEQHRNDGEKLTGKILGQLLGVSDGYARRLLRDISQIAAATPEAETSPIRRAQRTPLLASGPTADPN